MAIWKVAPTADQPDLTLTHWSIHEVASEIWVGNTRYLVGWCVENREGRVTSAIVSWDPSTMIGTTKSGRRYKLHDRPGLHDDAEYTWNRWKRFSKITDDRDVTEEFIEQPD
jgi:hypothetical protein